VLTSSREFAVYSLYLCMIGATPSLRRAFWILWACLLLLTPGMAAAGEPSLEVDFDGDGRGDFFAVSHNEPSIVRVWLSASRTTHRIRADVPLQRLAAVDLDGDRRPELIAGDGTLRIHVWTTQRNGFRFYRPHPGRPAGFTPSTHSGFDDSGGQPSGAIAGASFVPFPPTLRAPSVRRPVALVTIAPRPRQARASDPTLLAFVPRPPPTHTSR
jgi:hypothetical protein